MYFISLLQQKLCQIRTILSGNSSNQCNFSYRYNSFSFYYFWFVSSWLLFCFLLFRCFFFILAYYCFDFFFILSFFIKKNRTYLALFLHYIGFYRCCHCLRYSLGLMPSAFLNIRLKYPAPSIPTAHPISSIVNCVTSCKCNSAPLANADGVYKIRFD